MSVNIPWIFIKIVVPLMPIVINFILIKIERLDKEWYQFLAGGELFIFSTTFSTSNIGVTFFQGSSDNFLGQIGFCLLLSTILISIALFAYGRSIKLNEKKMGKIQDEELYAIVSIACAMAAIVGSYCINFYQVQ